MDTQDIVNHEPLQAQLEANESLLRKIFAHCDDVVYREICLGSSDQRGLVVFISNLIKKDLMDSTILRELLGGLRESKTISMNQIEHQLISASETHVVTNLMDVAGGIVSGQAVLMIDGEDSALTMDVLGWEHRAVEKSENEVTIRGSQQAFTENLMNNIALVRRFIADVRLKVEKGVIGEITHTPYSLLYVEGIVDPAILQEVKRRLHAKTVDKVFDSGNLKELFRDAPRSPFPTVNRTERPDRVVAQLLEGRVAILVENSPIALTMPSLFVEFLQAPEDYYENFLLQSAIRLLRYFALIMSLIVPSLYVALVGFHHELIPASMLPSVMSQREGIPMPTVFEVLIMEIMFEVLREAGLRLPRPIGQAISIVGALVVGQAAVQAKLVMATTVIVVATAGVTSFTIPGFGMAGAVRLLRFPLLILTGVLGLFGFTVGVFILLIHLMSLRSFGVIYTGGLAPRRWQDFKDTLIRTPEQTDVQTPWIGKKNTGSLKRK